MNALINAWKWAIHNVRVLPAVAKYFSHDCSTCFFYRGVVLGIAVSLLSTGWLWSAAAFFAVLTVIKIIDGVD